MLFLQAADSLLLTFIHSEILLNFFFDCSFLHLLVHFGFGFIPIVLILYRVHVMNILRSKYLHTGIPTWHIFCCNSRASASLIPYSFFISSSTFCLSLLLWAFFWIPYLSLISWRFFSLWYSSSMCCFFLSSSASLRAFFLFSSS